MRAKVFEARDISACVRMLLDLQTVCGGARQEGEYSR